MQHRLHPPVPVYDCSTCAERYRDDVLPARPGRLIRPLTPGALDELRPEPDPARRGRVLRDLGRVMVRRGPELQP